MPRKDRSAQPTRAEKLPAAHGFLRKLRRDNDAPVGAWAVDHAISAMSERGLLTRLRSVGVTGHPHPYVRDAARDAVFNAYVAASSVYTGKEAVAAHGDRETALRDFIDAIDVAV